MPGQAELCVGYSIFLTFVACLLQVTHMPNQLLILILVCMSVEYGLHCK